MRIAICVPHTGSIRAKCAQALNEMVAFTLGQNAVPVRFGFFFEEAGPLEYKRTRLALRGIEWGADHHFLLDWDHTFPPDTLLRLAKHRLQFVGINTPARHGNPVSTVHDGGGNRITGNGVQSVAAVGLGLALIRSDVFAATPKPWFRAQVSDDGRLVCGEDVHFCNQVRSAGIPVHVDHDIIVGHIAETVLTMEGMDACPVQPSTGDR